MRGADCGPGGSITLVSRLSPRVNYLCVAVDQDKSEPNGTNPLGAITFTDEQKLVIGGYQQHLGAPWNPADSWMLHYTGQLDEFRIFNKALTDAEINALFKLEALGR